MKNSVILLAFISLISCNDSKDSGYGEVIRDEKKARTLFNANLFVTADSDSKETRTITANNDTLEATYIFYKRGYRMNLGDSSLILVKNSTKSLLIDLPLQDSLKRFFYQKYISKNSK